MTELLKNAWAGWHDFTTSGKLAALLMIALLFLWIHYKKINQKSFVLYTTVAAVCCICPVTAVGLMLYQTRFYDYKWIWSIVPITAMLGFAATVFVTDFLKDYAENSRWKEVTAILLLAVMLVLGSGLNRDNQEIIEVQEDRNRAEQLLKKVQEYMGDRTIFLWAPREISEYAREWNAEIQLLYGRNMWEPALDAYVYDTYSDELRNLECWMEGNESDEVISDRECAEILASTEVNCILLPLDETEETIACFEQVLGVKAEPLENYYLLIR